MNVRLLSTSALLALGLTALFGYSSPARASDAKPTRMRIDLVYVESSSATATDQSTVDELLKSGGRIIGSPMVTVQDGMPVNTWLGVGLHEVGNRFSKSNPLRLRARGRLTVTFVTHVNTADSIQLRSVVGLSNREQAGHPDTVLPSYTRTMKVTPGSQSLCCSWSEGEKAVTLFVTVALQKP